MRNTHIINGVEYRALPNWQLIDKDGNRLMYHKGRVYIIDQYEKLIKKENFK